MTAQTQLATSGISMSVAAATSLELERVKQVHLQQEIQAIEKKSVEAQLESDKSVQKDSAAMALKE
eukprot:gene28308-35066_t